MCKGSRILITGLLPPSLSTSRRAVLVAFLLQCMAVRMKRSRYIWSSPSSSCAVKERVIKQNHHCISQFSVVINSCHHKLIKRITASRSLSSFKASIHRPRTVSRHYGSNTWWDKNHSPFCLGHIRETRREHFCGHSPRSRSHPQWCGILPRIHLHNPRDSASTFPALSWA